MEYRVFRNPGLERRADGRPKPFGRRAGPVQTTDGRVTAGRLVLALLLGIGLGAIGLMLAPAL